MKSRLSSIANWRTLAVAAAVLGVVAAAGSVQAAPLIYQISVRDQDLNTGVIVIDSVTTAQDGWVVVYRNPDFAIGEIVGYAPVHQGVNTGVRVTINTGMVGTLPTLWAVLHADNGVKGLFEWGLRGFAYNDAPVVVNGHDVVAEFGTWASQATANMPPSAPSAPPQVAPAGNVGIVVKDQDLNTGVIVLDSVTAPQDGWVVVYRNPDLTNGEIVGYAPVHQGVNTNVPVTINTGMVGGLPTLWAVLHADNGVKGLFEWGLNNLPYDDGPVVVNGHDVVIAFGTSAAQAVNMPPNVSSASPVVPAGKIGINVKSQDLNTGVIVLDSVTSPEDGWVVVYRNPDFLSGDIVGYAPVHQGLNTNVRVTINTGMVGTLPTLWAQLQADNGVKGLFEWGLRGFAYDDGPIAVNGHDVVAAFGTSAAQ